MPDLVFRNVRLFNVSQSNVCLFKVNNYNKVWNMFKGNNNDAIDIVNIEYR